LFTILKNPLKIVAEYTYILAIFFFNMIWMSPNYLFMLVNYHPGFGALGLIDIFERSIDNWYVLATTGLTIVGGPIGCILQICLISKRTGFYS
jgi:hypothetical protein